MITIEELKTKPVMALSWKEPYGTLMLQGKIETRTWNTKYRGLVLLCASKTGYQWNQVLNISGGVQSQRVYAAIGHGWSPEVDLCSKAFAIGRLVDCRPMTSRDENFAYVEYRDPWQEVRYTKGGRRTKLCRLFAHIYADVTPIELIPWSGSQGFRNVPLDIISQIKFCQTLETV